MAKSIDNNLSDRVKIQEKAVSNLADTMYRRESELEEEIRDIQAELNIPASTLSHHLEKLKNEELVTVRRDRQFLWYAANADILQELLGFLYAECCSRNKAVEPASFVTIGKAGAKS